MAVAFTPGQTIGQGDLDIFLTNAGGFPADAYSITYALYYVSPGPPETEVLIGSAVRVPVHPTVGEYYASLTVPPMATPGEYRIRWTFQQFAGAPPQQVVMEWAVVAAGLIAVGAYSTLTQGMIDKLRILLRDSRPDRDYHFRPPEAEGNIGAYNRVFGYVWQDNELFEYLERGMDWWNMMPPSTGGFTLDQMVQQKPEWRTAVLWEAITHACFALAANWVVDEFSVKSDTYVRVALPDGRSEALSIGDLYEICQGIGTMPDEATRAAIREAYRAGTLKVEAVDPATGAASLQTVTAVLKHNTPHKDMVRVTLADDRWVECTVDHSLFTMAGEGVTPVLAGELRVGSVLATVSQGVALGVEVASVVALPPEEHTYDLSVPGPQNFVLANGILAHNSYSIGGISLDIEKASKYESLKQNAESQFDKAAEAKARTVKFMRGIQQPKYGVGIRSAFGPNVGRGVLSPRNFL